MSSVTVPLLEEDDDTLAFGDDLDTQTSQKFTHPYVTFFHLAFRSAALIVYLFCGLPDAGFIASFVTIVLLLSMDFWTVKNVTGRLMVGLRWWNYVDDEGNSHWVYESKKASQQGRVNETEVRIFWLSLLSAPAIWSFLFIVALIRFNPKWLLVVVIALMLNGANMFGYIRCKLGTSESLIGITRTFLQKQFLQGATSILTSQGTSTQNPSTPSQQPVNLI